MFGGIDFNGNALADVWLYDPAANAWTQVPTTGFVARGNLAGAAAAGAAYAVGGLLVQWLGHGREHASNPLLIEGATHLSLLFLWPVSRRPVRTSSPVGFSPTLRGAAAT
ncbi:MAG: kelch repeat-containing protein [Gemmatimonadaceae bacterium]